MRSPGIPLKVIDFNLVNGIWSVCLGISGSIRPFVNCHCYLTIYGKLPTNGSGYLGMHLHFRTARDEVRRGLYPCRLIVHDEAERYPAFSAWFPEFTQFVQQCHSWMLRITTTRRTISGLYAGLKRWRLDWKTRLRRLTACRRSEESAIPVQDTHCPYQPSRRPMKRHLGPQDHRESFSSWTNTAPRQGAAKMVAAASTNHCVIGYPPPVRAAEHDCGNRPKSASWTNHQPCEDNWGSYRAIP